MRTKKSLLLLLTLLLALSIPMVGCGREEETEIETPNGEVEVERETDAEGRTEEVEVDRDGDNADLGEDLEDSGITAKVKTQLASDNRVEANDLNVDTEAGVVTLKGNVGTDEAKAAAEEIARATDGVTDVVNMITVGGGKDSAS